jgi:hypothetical protein
LWFFYVAIFDAARQYRIARILHKLIRTTHLELQTTVRLGNSGNSGQQKKSAQLADLIKQSNQSFLKRLSQFRPADDGREKGAVLQDSVTNPMATKASMRKAIEFSEETKIRVAEIIPVPRLNLDCADNVYSWLYIRIVLQNFGFRVRNRIDIYVSIVLFVILGLMAATIGKLYRASQSSDNSMLSDTLKGQVFVQIQIVVGTFLICLIVLAHFGNLVNNQFMTHRGEMMSYMLKNKVKLYHMKKAGEFSSEQREELEDAVGALEVTISAIEINNELSPYRVSQITKYSYYKYIIYL